MVTSATLGEVRVGDVDIIGDWVEREIVDVIGDIPFEDVSTTTANCGGFLYSRQYGLSEKSRDYISG